MPVDEMSAMSLTASYFAQKRLPDPVVVSPDLGNTKRARNFAEIVDAPLAIIEKRRAGNRDRTEVLNLIGSVEGRQAIIVDDEIDTADQSPRRPRSVRGGRDRGLCVGNPPGALRTRGSDCKNAQSGKWSSPTASRSLKKSASPNSPSCRGVAAWRDRAADPHRGQRLGDLSHPGRAGGDLGCALAAVHLPPRDPVGEGEPATAGVVIRLA